MAPARTLIVAAALLAAGARTAGSQTSSESPLRPELRVDAIAARVTHAHVGAGVGIRMGYNVRLHLAAAGGRAFHGGEAARSARGDATLRLLLDPFGETRTGLAIGGGLSVLHDGFERTRPVGVLVLGVEGPPRRRAVWAVEVALGGGVRAGVVLRPRARGYR